MHRPGHHGRVGWRCGDRRGRQHAAGSSEGGDGRGAEHAVGVVGSDKDTGEGRDAGAGDGRSPHRATRMRIVDAGDERNEADGTSGAMPPKAASRVTRPGVAPWEWVRRLRCCGGIVKHDVKTGDGRSRKSDARARTDRSEGGPWGVRRCTGSPRPARTRVRAGPSAAAPFCRLRSRSCPPCPVGSYYRMIGRVLRLADGAVGIKPNRVNSEVAATPCRRSRSRPRA